MTQWFEPTVDLVDRFGFSLNFVDVFWAFIKFRWPFSGIRLKRFDSSLLMTQVLSRRPESIIIMIQAAFQELTRNQFMTQVDSPGIDSDWLLTQSASHFSIQLNFWLKRKAFDSESTHDSTESYPYLVVSNDILVSYWQSWCATGH